MKRIKMWGLLAMLASGSVFQLVGCFDGLLDGVVKGFLGKGIVDNVYLDVLTDWLLEDMFIN